MFQQYVCLYSSFSDFRKVRNFFFASFMMNPPFSSRSPLPFQKKHFTQARRNCRRRVAGKGNVDDPMDAAATFYPLVIIAIAE
jgi:hypothetical protein